MYDSNTISIASEFIAPLLLSFALILLQGGVPDRVGWVRAEGGYLKLTDTQAFHEASPISAI